MAANNDITQTAPCALSLKVVLFCTKTKEVEEKVITFESFPVTILDIKKKMEKQHSVPVCVQELSYDGHEVNDSVELSTMKVRNGDTFHIKYLAKGHCSEIDDTLIMLNALLAAIESKNLTTDGEKEPLMLTEIISTIDFNVEQMLQDLAFEYFSSTLDPQAYVNKLHFAHHDGIELLMKIYQTLLLMPWYPKSYDPKATECLILVVLWNFADNVLGCRVVIHHKVVQMCTQSMLRVRLEEGKKIQEIVPLYTPQEISILLETIEAAVGILGNVADVPNSMMSEIPECRIEIASNEDILQQMTCLSVINANGDNVQYSLPIANIFVCLAFTSETHMYLAKQTFIRRLLHSYQTFLGHDLEEEQLLLRCCTMVFFAQVALASPHCIPQDYQQEITSEMESFLETTHYQTIMESQIKHGYVWCTFLPYIKLAYIPKSSEAMSELQLTSIQLIIFNLQNMLGRADHREILLKEGLLDYVMCMPQYVPASLRPQAEELVRMVASAPDIPEGPPKLLNLVKACLARIHFGLEQVLSLSVSEIVSKVLPI